LHALSILDRDGDRFPALARLQGVEGIHREAWREWKDRYGRARISPLGSDRIAAGFYVAKYMFKGGDSIGTFLPESGWGPYLPE